MPLENPILILLQEQLINSQEFIIRATQKKETAQELENIVITNKYNQLIR